jgi:hypothetical protein
MSKHPLIAKWVIKMTDTFPEKRPSCEEILKGDLIPRTLCQRKLFGELDGVSGAWRRLFLSSPLANLSVQTKPTKYWSYCVATRSQIVRIAQNGTEPCW